MKRLAAILALALLLGFGGARLLAGDGSTDAAIATGCDPAAAIPTSGVVSLAYTAPSAPPHDDHDDYVLGGRLRWDSQAALECVGTEDDAAYEHEIVFDGDFAGRIWRLEHTFPEAAEVYADHVVNDRDGRTVLTLGVFRPEHLAAGADYWFTLDTPLLAEPGSREHAFTLDGEIGNRICSDPTAWCVERSNVAAKRSLVGGDRGFDVALGGCWAWENDVVSPCSGLAFPAADDAAIDTAESGASIDLPSTELGPDDDAVSDASTSAGPSSAAGDTAGGPVPTSPAPPGTPSTPGAPATTVTGHSTGATSTTVASQAPPGTPTTSVAPGGATTTVPRATTTTAPTTTTPGTPITTTTSAPAPTVPIPTTTRPPTTSPPTTRPPVTAPPTTGPPVTSPPTTRPPVTSPPTTAPPTTPPPTVSPTTAPPTTIAPAAPSFRTISATSSRPGRVRVVARVAWPADVTDPTCVITLDGAVVSIRECGARLSINLRGVSPGTHTVRVRACNASVACTDSPPVDVVVG